MKRWCIAIGRTLVGAFSGALVGIAVGPVLVTFGLTVAGSLFAGPLPGGAWRTALASASLTAVPIGAIAGAWIGYSTRHIPWDELP